MDLSPHQVRQAETQRTSADGAVTARPSPRPTSGSWCPSNRRPRPHPNGRPYRLSGQDALAIRASKKLRSDELLLPSLGPTRLRMELDRVPLWRGPHVDIRQLVEDFGSYGYLPRLKDPAEVLRATIVAGVRLLTWEQDSFAYAESWDEATSENTEV